MKDPAYSTTTGAQRAALRHQIRTGKYVVDPARVAQAMLERLGAKSAGFRSDAARTEHRALELF